MKKDKGLPKLLKTIYKEVIIKGRKGEIRSSNKRITFLQVILLLGGAIIIFRLFNLQYFNSSYYKALALGQHEMEKILKPKRGEIFVHDKMENKNYPLATYRELASVYIVPKDIEQHLIVVNELENILGIDREELLIKVYKENDPYEPIAKKVDDETLEKILALDLKGIGYIKEKWRYYPEGNLASHLVGFVGNRNGEQFGQYGIEGYWQKVLAGKEGSLWAEKDNFGRWIALSEKHLEKATNGSDIVLTIDRSIQYFSCKKLKEYTEKFNAQGGVVLVMQPQTGAILAMCGQPDFNLNEYNKVEDIGVYNNPAIFASYEPGSIFKPITLASALDQGLISPTSTYVDMGVVEIGPYKIRNVDKKAYGEQTMTSVLENSLNTGTIYVSELLGYRKFKNYIENFGFGTKTGIKLVGESSGNITSLNKISQIYVATASFGQGIMVTPLQMITAFSSLANEGKLMKPYIVDEIIDSHGSKHKQKPEIVRQVISPRAASLITSMLVSVIKNGHAQTAGVDGYYLAGKTGTAQMVQAGNTDYGDKTIHSFVGYGPANKHEFVILTRLDAPEVDYAVGSAAPLFREISEYILDYLNIPKDY